MSHFAKVENGIVTEVLVIEQDVIDTGLFGDPAMWVQTSYNNNPVEGASRGKYAGIGDTWDGTVFASPVSGEPA